MGRGQRLACLLIGPETATAQDPSRAERSSLTDPSPCVSETTVTSQRGRGRLHTPGIGFMQLEEASMRLRFCSLSTPLVHQYKCMKRNREFPDALTVLPDALTTSLSRPVGHVTRQKRLQLLHLKTGGSVSRVAAIRGIALDVGWPVGEGLWASSEGS
jgi:hypothetical protein